MARRQRCGRLCVALGLGVALVLAGLAPADAVSNGTPVRPRSLTPVGAYPWLVRLAEPDGSTRCTGTLVSRRFVLTAAHCTGSRMVARIGRTGLRVGVVGQHVHPEWNGVDPDFDAAVLQLAHPVRGPAVPLASSFSTLTEGTRVRLLGWGQRSIGNTRDPRRPAIGRAVVSESGPLVFVADADPAAACPGDSGGPVLGAGGVQVGIMTFSDEDCTAFTGASRLSSLREFIEGFVQRNRPPTAQGGAIEADPSEQVTIPLQYADPDGDEVQVTDVQFGGLNPIATTADPPSITFGAPNETREATVRFTVSDGLAETTATWTISYASRAVLAVGEANEPAAGQQSTVQVGVFMTRASTQPVTVRIDPGSDTAELGVDALAAPATITFDPGETLATYDVVVVGDDVDEFDEFLSLTVTVLDGSANGSGGSLRIIGTAVNHPPVVLGGEVTAAPQTPFEIPIDVSDPDGHEVFVNDLRWSESELELVSCGGDTSLTCTFQSLPGFVGNATITIEAQDEFGAVATGDWVAHVG